MEVTHHGADFGPASDTRAAYDTLRRISAQSLGSLNSTEILAIVQLVVDAMVFLWTKEDRVSIADIIHHFLPILGIAPKMKVSKILTLLFSTTEGSGMGVEMQLQLSAVMIEWARQEKRNFIRQRLQFRRASLLFRAGKHQQCIDAAEPLTREAIKQDDKVLLTELYLLSSQCYYAMQNMDKASGSLMAARANSNNIYCEQALQAKLDFHSGILALKAKEKTTAYSFFCESFENYHKRDPTRAQEALKLMLICKIGSNSSSQIVQALSRKNVEKYDGRVIEAVQLLTDSYIGRDTSTFQATLTHYADVLIAESLAAEILRDLYEGLTNLRLMQIIEPYSRVEIEYIAEIMQLSAGEVEAKLSQMILDKRVDALIDQQKRCLIMKYSNTKSTNAQEAFEILENLGDLVRDLIKDQSV